MQKKFNSFLVAGVTLAMHFQVSAAIIVCPQHAPAETVVINVGDAHARKVGNDFFGFDAPWSEFQASYFYRGTVKDKLIEYLKPFPGALYRYPGGNYFLWENSVLNAAVRKSNFTEYLGYQKPEFGLQEFLRFLKDVEGSGIYMLNLLGDKKTPYSLEKIKASNLALIRWVRAHPQGARIKYWELANELDWEPFNFSAAMYINKMQGTLVEAKKEFPAEKFIVAGRTNPWKFGKVSEIAFNQEVLQAYPFYGIALHAYYDGYPMPMMQETIKRFGQQKNKSGQIPKVFVTEHGRWPSENPKGRWEENWYQASGSLGAISASDFTLMSLSAPEVETAIWHSLGVHGPWQLIHHNPDNASLYPSATYWALRTLRAGFLEQVINVSLDKNSSREYAGGYSFRLTAMQGKNKEFSLLGVNRSRVSLNIAASLANKAAFKVTAINTTQFDPAGADNDKTNPNRFEMHTQVPAAKYLQQFTLCVPPFSVFSLTASIE